VRPINEINDPRLVKALAHPLRVKILSALEHRIASPSQLAEELEVPLPNLSYHIRMLVQLDMLKLVKTRPRRGAIEHYYQAKGRVVVSDRAWGEVPSLVKEAMVSAALKQAGELVEAGAARGGFEDAHAHLSRQALKLDEKAWKELSKRVSELHEFAVKLQADSQKRNADNDHWNEVDAALVMMYFKAPPVDMPAAENDGDAKTEHKRRSRSKSRSRT
jgi:DNA-binding transcriptional ArsR family regulator